MKSNKNKPGVPALRRDRYSSPREAECIAHAKSYPFWASKGFIWIFTLILSALDAVILYGIIDDAMRQSWWIQVLTAAGIALVLNVLPMGAAWFVHLATYRIGHNARRNAILCVAIFAVLFTGTVMLRFAYQGSYTDTESSNHMVNEVETDAGSKEDIDSISVKSFALALLLSLEPLATSGLNFALAYIAADPLKQEIEQLRIRRIELKEVKTDLEAALVSMKEDEDRLIAMDEARYLAACDMAVTKCDALKAKARFMLAEYLKDPQSISALSEEALDAVKADAPGTVLDIRPLESA